MNIEENLEKLRKEYIKIMPPEGFTIHGWENLRSSGNEQPKIRYPFAPAARGLVFASILLILLGASSAAVYASQKSFPGQPLYPVKRLSENITLIVSGNRQQLVERRAQELIILSEKEKDPKLLEKATEDYEEAIRKTQKRLHEREDEKEEFRRRLQDQERRLRIIIEQNPEDKDELEEAIKIIKENKNGNEDVKSEQDSNRNLDDRSGPSSGKD